ncbi:PREDICTED: transmembrane protein 267-like [Branchiostoma belcheri]|uniref:Transmembrane protein 267 n=1 Tax=Branchiostoma belcheri TaxID=7741 RepID=A0A6P4Y1L0_BRABE|nr:PREDICTED: transmembrane protein 267-like [Branchiostoma belcheri]
MSTLQSFLAGFSKLFSVKSTISSVLLGGFCIAADRVLRLKPVSDHALLRVITDNSAHGLVGLWSWGIVSGLRTRHDVLHTLLCGLLASLVDTDHFIAARSFRLKDALSLPERPPFHATSLLLSTVFTMWILLKMMDWKALHILPWVCTVAWLSHHIRDGTRRGLWFPPIGSSPPIPYWLYIGLIVLLPNVVILCLHYSTVFDQTRIVNAPLISNV